jgi:hypothetical protein
MFNNPSSPTHLHQSLKITIFWVIIVNFEGISCILETIWQCHGRWVVSIHSAVYLLPLIQNISNNHASLDKHFFLVFYEQIQVYSYERLFSSLRTLRMSWMGWWNNEIPTTSSGSYSHCFVLSPPRLLESQLCRPGSSSPLLRRPLRSDTMAERRPPSPVHSSCNRSRSSCSLGFAFMAVYFMASGAMPIYRSRSRPLFRGGMGWLTSSYARPSWWRRKEERRSGEHSVNKASLAFLFCCSSIALILLVAQ